MNENQTPFLVWPSFLYVNQLFIRLYRSTDSIKYIDTSTGKVKIYIYHMNILIEIFVSLNK